MNVLSSLQPATLPERDVGVKRMVVTQAGVSRVIPAKRWVDDLRPTDVVVYNHSSVLPARFAGRHPKTGATLEMRLAQSLADHPEDRSHWLVVFWHGFTTKVVTETRKVVDDLNAGDRVAFQDAYARIENNLGDGLYRIEVHSIKESPLTWMLRTGQPVQYSYLEKDLRIWDVQTIFAGPVWSLEPPSAAFLLDWETLLKLRQSGIRLVPIAHSAGLSSLGSAAVDARLPLQEWSRISSSSAEILNAAAKAGDRVLALGTTVARCLEASFRRGRGHFLPETFRNHLVLGPHEKIRSFDVLITGLHDSTESHFSLEQALIPKDEAEAALHLASEKGLHHHEFGDFHWIEK